MIQAVAENVARKGDAHKEFLLTAAANLNRIKRPPFSAIKAVTALDCTVSPQVFCFTITAVLFPMKVIDRFVGGGVGFFEQVKII